jgi:hypothetical protein
MKSNEVDDACLSAMRKIAPMDLEIVIGIKEAGHDLTYNLDVAFCLFRTQIQRDRSDPLWPLCDDYSCVPSPRRAFIHVAAPRSRHGLTETAQALYAGCRE